MKDPDDTTPVHLVTPFPILTEEEVHPGPPQSPPAQERDGVWLDPEALRNLRDYMAATKRLKKNYRTLKTRCRQLSDALRKSAGPAAGTHADGGALERERLREIVMGLTRCRWWQISRRSDLIAELEALLEDRPE